MRLDGGAAAANRRRQGKDWNPATAANYTAILLELFA